MRPGKILIADDEPQIRNNISILLSKKAGLEVIQASTGEEAIDLHQKESPELILLDYNMPGMNGGEVLKKIRTKDPYVRILFLTARNEDATLVNMLNSGADDYITKPYSQAELLARINTNLRIYQLNRDLHQAVHTDDLTGLKNMRGVYSLIDEMIEDCAAKETQMALAMMDMDKFKAVNDGHDHLFGSFVLSECGALIRNHISKKGHGIRFGGDEFMMLIPNTTESEAVQLCEEYRKLVEEHLFKDGEDEMYLTTSIGLAVTTNEPSGLNSQSLVRVADDALYRAKESGRNKVVTSKQDEDPTPFSRAIKKGEIKRYHL
ncbi:MAG: diguanylate cyclase [Bacteriovoracaceae bacterium]|nr:diguanylate cyclase [Bacteriovoracaceae bacterium]